VRINPAEMARDASTHSSMWSVRQKYAFTKRYAEGPLVIQRIRCADIGGH
jgi:hypothetical protein